MAARKPKSNVDYSKSQDIKKIPFAEQITTRMKPYMEALTNDLTKGGIEAFDEYIENLPLPGELSDADNLSTGESIDDKLDEIKESVIDNSARERVTAVGASLKIISMLEGFLADNERMSRELSKQEKLADDAEARKTESQVAWSKSVDSKLDRNNRAINDVPEKTRKYIRRHKNGFLKFLAETFLGVMFFLSAPVRKFFDDIGFGEVLGNVRKLIEEKFPALMPIVEKVRTIYDKVTDFVDNTWKGALEAIQYIHEFAVYFHQKFGMDKQEREDYWYGRYKDAGLDKASTDEEYASIAASVEKRYGYSEAFPIERKAREKAIDRIANDRLPMMAAKVRDSLIAGRGQGIVHIQPQSKIDELQSKYGSTPIDADYDGNIDYGHQVVQGTDGQMYVTQQTWNTVIENSKNEYTH